MLYQNRYRYSNLVFCELYVIFSYAKNSCDNIQQHVAKQIPVTTFSLKQMMNRKHLKYTHLDVLHVLKYMTSQHLKSAAAVTQAIFPTLFHCLLYRSVENSNDEKLPCTAYCLMTVRSWLMRAASTTLKLNRSGHWPKPTVVYFYCSVYHNDL